MADARAPVYNNSKQRSSPSCPSATNDLHVCTLPHGTRLLAHLAFAVSCLDTPPLRKGDTHYREVYDLTGQFASPITVSSGSPGREDDDLTQQTQQVNTLSTRPLVVERNNGDRASLVGPAECEAVLHLTRKVFYLDADGTLLSVSSSTLPSAVIQAFQNHYGDLDDRVIERYKGHAKTAHCLFTLRSKNARQINIHTTDEQYAACQACTKKRRLCVAIDEKGKVHVRPLGRSLRGNALSTQKAFFILDDGIAVANKHFTHARPRTVI